MAEATGRRRVNTPPSLKKPKLFSTSEDNRTDTYPLTHLGSVQGKDWAHKAEFSVSGKPGDGGSNPGRLLFPPPTPEENQQLKKRADS